MKWIIGCYFLLFLLPLHSQNGTKYWHPLARTEATIPFASAANYQVYQLDLAQLQTSLLQKDGQPLRITLPLPDGDFYTIALEETSVMASELAMRYPAIRTLRAAPNAAPARVDLSPDGFHAMLEINERTVYVDPIRNEYNKYISYYADDFVSTTISSCATQSSDTSLELTSDLIQQRENAVSLRVFRLAVACTGEFVQQFGGNVQSALAMVASAVNRMNHIYERDLSVRFQLVANNDQLIFTNPATDPFPTTDQVSEILNRSSYIFEYNLPISLRQYDLGHIFVVNCAGANGIAHLRSLCRNNRAGGVTCFTSADLDAVVTNIFAHEIGHQIAANHTFSASCNTFQYFVGLEPFCGHSIMSYNLQDKLPYFHAISLQNMLTVIRQRSDEGCGTIVPTVENTAPTVTHAHRNGLYIPIQTPFALEALGQDADQDSLTYSWEQNNPGENTSLFRMFAPTPNPRRTFPAMSTLLSGQNDPFEVLPTGNQQLNFRCVVRDNHSGGGAVAWTDVEVNTNANVGPFQVVFPNDHSTSLEIGSFVDIRWAVANTHTFPVNCRQVNIRLSTDGGNTYPYTLAKRVENNGFATVQLPTVITKHARILIEAADNIFFDISDTDFQINAPNEPAYTLQVAPRQIPLHCLPEPLRFLISIDTLLGYNEWVQLDLVGELPDDVSAVFTQSRVIPPAQVELVFNFHEQTQQFFTFQVKATNAAGRIILVPIDFTILPNHLSNLQAGYPEDGALVSSRQSSFFTWEAPMGARTYDFELATTPAFGTSIIRSFANLSSPAFFPNVRFQAGQLYYWRVRAKNDCTEGEFSEPFVFSGGACRQYPVVTTPIPIPPNQISHAEVFIKDSVIISDINMLNLRIKTNQVNALRVSLIDPSGRRELVYDQACGSSQNIFLNFDGEVFNTSIACPPENGQTVRPRGFFSNYYGKNAAGIWTLQMQNYASGNSLGELQAATLEICGNFHSSTLVLAQNDTLFVPNRGSQRYTPAQLEMDHSTQQLTYTLVVAPRKGDLRLHDTLLKAGNQFTQQDINDLQLQYLHKGEAVGIDSFTFVVEDGRGGWLPKQRAYIQIQQNPTSSTNQHWNEQHITIFPNPTQDLLNIQFNYLSENVIKINLYNINGQLLQYKQVNNPTTLLQFNTSHLVNGIYFLNIQTAQGSVTKKVLIQH
ncbi:MAG: reprolysin-like metallopeptidase [Saprospiraceae bacterium]